MNRKIRVLTPIQVSNLDRDVDIKSLWVVLNQYVEGLYLRINLKDLEDWNLLISVTSRPTNGIGVFKRVIRYSSDKEFEVSISIAIPNDDEAPYGLSKVKDSFYVPLNEKNFYILEPHFEKYQNLYQYILESSKRAIDVAFTKGFTCNGKKIKFQE